MPLVLLVVLAVAWVVIWYVAYRFATGYVVEIADGEVAEGTIVLCAKRSVAGFPLTLSVDCGNAAMIGDNFSLEVGGFSARTELYRPGRAEIDLVGPLTLADVNHLTAAEWSSARATASLWLDGVREATASFAGVALSVTNADGGGAWSGRASRWEMDVAPSAGGAPSLRVALAAADLEIQIGSERYPSLSGNATLTVPGIGNRLDAPPDALMGEWLRSGGNFYIDDMTLTSGDVIAEVSGPMILEVDGTLSGDLVVRYLGQEDLPTLVAAIFPWLGDDAILIADGLRALSRPIEMRGEPAHEARLVFNHGSIAIGLIPIPGVTIPSMGSFEHLL